MRTLLLSLFAISALLFITLPTASCQDYGFLSNEVADAPVEEDDSDELPLPSIQVTTVIIRAQTDSSADNVPAESDLIVLDLSAGTLSDNDNNNNNNDAVDVDADVDSSAAADESTDESSDDNDDGSSDDEEVNTDDADNTNNDSEDSDNANSNADNIDPPSDDEDTDADETN